MKKSNLTKQCFCYNSGCCVNSPDRFSDDKLSILYKLRANHYIADLFFCVNIVLDFSNNKHYKCIVYDMIQSTTCNE